MQIIIVHCIMRIVLWKLHFADCIMQIANGLNGTIIFWNYIVQKSNLF